MLFLFKEKEEGYTEKYAQNVSFHFSMLRMCKCFYLSNATAVTEPKDSLNNVVIAIMIKQKRLNVSDRSTGTLRGNPLDFFFHLLVSFPKFGTVICYAGVDLRGHNRGENFGWMGIHVDPEVN